MVQVTLKNKFGVHMEINNKTVIIIGVIGIGLGALWIHYNDLALAVVSGLVGYLSKDTIDYTDNSDNEINNQSRNQTNE